ncbi:hypothetical protein MKX01_015349 [Papaver californicum]|nr:hypothetical protein MKX01_015349 [Papaver californicum]
MYLFCGEFGCVLFTGDFRWERTSERALMGKSMLLNALGVEKVDFLHLDSTYCNPSYSFPPREVVARQIVKITASHPQHEFIIAINTLGKEDFLLHIASALNTKIWVWPERLQIMHVLGFFDVFTTNTSLTRIRAVPFYSFSIDTLEGLNSIRPTIGIMPSGLSWVVRPHDDPSPSSSLSVGDNSSNCNTNENHQQNEELSCVRKFHKYIYTFPYSDHSCFNEIREFVKLVQPLNIKGIVSLSSCYIDPRYYFRDLHGQDECKDPSSNKFQQQSEKFQRETLNSIAEEFVTKSYKGSHTTHTQIRTERSLRRKSSYLGLIMSRVSILRRRKRGAKILEIDIIE